MATLGATRCYLGGDHKVVTWVHHFAVSFVVQDEVWEGHKTNGQQTE